MNTRAHLEDLSDTKMLKSVRLCPATRICSNIPHLFKAHVYVVFGRGRSPFALVTEVYHLVRCATDTGSGFPGKLLK